MISLKYHTIVKLPIRGIRHRDVLINTLPPGRMSKQRLSGSWTKTITEIKLKDPERQDLPE